MGAVLLLMAIGLLSLFSLREASSFPFFERQLIWAGIGLILLFFSSFVDFRLFRTQTGFVLGFYVMVLALLLLVFVGNAGVRGVESWLSFGTVFVQPVELAKLVLIILLAKYFSKRHVEIYRTRHLVVSGIYFGIPAFLVLAQPDVGSAAVLAAIWVIMIIFSGMKLRHFFLLLFVGAVLFGVGWNMVLEPYQKDRIRSFLDPFRDPRGSGYQTIQSMIAVGSGRVWGKGFGYGSQSHLNFLPEAETDFIFAAYAEEWGFVGVFILLGIVFVLLWRILWIGIGASDNFSRLYTIGFAALVFSQSFIHIGMNIGVLPVTGLPLPFVSYGGSSLVTLLIGVGIVQNINMNSRRAIDMR